MRPTLFYILVWWAFHTCFSNTYLLHSPTFYKYKLHKKDTEIFCVSQLKHSEALLKANHIHMSIKFLCVYLNPGFISDTHSPVTDALASIQLVKKYYGKPVMLNEAKKRLLQVRPSPSWVKRIGYHYEGVCLAGFSPDMCSCGAPTLRT